MRNERRLRPLHEYEVTFGYAVDTNDVIKTDTFTADDHDFDGRRTLFYNCGNVIREYHTPVISMKISPVDEEDLADIQE